MGDTLKILLSRTFFFSKIVLNYIYSDSEYKMKPGRNETINMGKWKGNESCPDPMILFESIVFKLDDLVERITYEFFEEESQGI